MKPLFYVSLTAVLLLFSSCKKEEKDPNPFEGTTWVRTIDSTFGDDYLYVLELNDDTFSYYEADIDGNYQSGMTEGSYSYTGNEIFIANVKDNTATLYEEYITGATVSGNTLKLHRTYVVDGVRHTSNDTMTRK